MSCLGLNASSCWPVRYYLPVFDKDTIHDYLYLTRDRFSTYDQGGGNDANYQAGARKSAASAPRNSRLYAGRHCRNSWDFPLCRGSTGGGEQKSRQRGTNDAEQ